MKLPLYRYRKVQRRAHTDRDGGFRVEIIHLFANRRRYGFVFNFAQAGTVHVPNSSLSNVSQPRFRRSDKPEGEKQRYDDRQAFNPRRVRQQLRRDNRRGQRAGNQPDAHSPLPFL